MAVHFLNPEKELGAGESSPVTANNWPPVIAGRWPEPSLMADNWPADWHRQGRFHG
jgi:hypothetical protein